MFNLANLKEVAGLIATYRDDPEASTEELAALAEIFQPKTIELLGRSTNRIKVLQAFGFTDEEINGVTYLMGYVPNR